MVTGFGRQDYGQVLAGGVLVAGLCLVANERSGTVAVLRLLPDGRLAATGELLSVPGVACLARA